MALNKLLILKEDQLLKLLEDSGHQEIAIILKNRDINGQKLLNLTEIQTKFWRLNRLQTKELLNFVALVNKNPAILTNQLKSSLNRGQAPLTIQPKLPSKSNNKAQLKFNQKLEIVLSTNPATSAPCNFLPYPERPLRPIPKLAFYEADSRTPEPAPYQINLPEINLISPKLKPSPPTQDQLVGKTKLRPPLPTPIEDTSLEIYENIQRKPSIDGSYLDKNELERSYVNSSLVLECSEEPRLIPASPIEIEPSKFKSTNAYFEVGDSRDANEKTGNGYLDLDDIRKPQVQLVKDFTKLILNPQASRGSKSPTREPLKVKENKLGTLGKLFSKKKSVNIQQGNYENHMVNGEVSSQDKKWTVSQKNRPLPEIPNFEKIPKKYEVKNHSLDNQITTRSFKKTTTDPTIKLPIVPNQNKYLYQNLKGSSSNEDIFKAQTEYRNFPLQGPQLPKSQFQLEPKKNFSRTKSPSLSEFEDDKKRFYQNIPNKNSFSSSDKFDHLGHSHQERNLREAYRYEEHIIRDLEKNRPISEDNEYVRVVSIHDEKFFKNTTRQGAKELLRNTPDGAFLFRPSEKYFLVLTLRYNGKCYNLGIERTPSSKIRLHADTNCISPEFENLRAFVNYFANKEAVTFKDVDNSLVEIYLKQTI